MSFPNAILTRALPFFTETLFATRVDDQGRFAIVLREAGDYVLTVQDPVTGLSTTIPVSVVDATQVTDVGTVSLPEQMSQGGTVTDHDGMPMPNATVGLTSSVGPDLVYTNGRVPRVDVLHLHHGVWLNMSRQDATVPAAQEMVPTHRRAPHD